MEFYRNDKGLEELKAHLKDLATTALDVGYFDGKIHQKENIPIAEVAIVNNNGAPEKSIPERPFFSESIQMAWINKGALEGFSKIINPEMPKEVTLAKIGEWTKNIIQWNIRHGNWTPNAPSTIEQKGFNQPLMETGQLEDDVEWRIRKTL